MGWGELQGAEPQVRADSTRFQGGDSSLGPSRERLDRSAAPYDVLDAIASEARRNSERWFPQVHDPETALVPLAVHYALGMCGEAGEVANLVKKALRKGETTSEGLADELADVFIYLLLLADEVGVNLYAAYQAKAAICEKRWGRLP